jgi:hypothetical protein
VTAAIRPPIAGPVWTYVGTDAARDRLAAGLETSRAVISRDYLERVEEGFRRLGEAEWRRYVASTDRPPCPVRALRRIDLPAAAGPPGSGA